MAQDKPTVLCVKTRHSLLDEAARLLAEAGCDVIGTASAESALQLVRTRPVDGVMIDLFLREPAANVLRDDIRALQPGVPVLVFHGGALLKLEVEVLMAWIHRAQRAAHHEQESALAHALRDYPAGKERKEAESAVR